RDLNVHLLHVETKRTAEAVAELEANYRRMIDENPDDYLPHLLLSVLLIKGTATNEALVEGELAYDLAPENPDVLGGRIVISFGARFLALMNKHLEEYRQIGSAATYLSFKGLHAFLSNENPDEAIAYLSEAVRLE